AARDDRCLCRSQSAKPSMGAEILDRAGIPAAATERAHASARLSGSTRGDVAACATYKQLKHVRYLGVPGFDRTRTHALVSVIKSCGGLCGSGGIFAVEKIDGRWQRSAPTDFTRNCSWMY
ncbi:MAG TPA: hypothetical protein VHT24_13405, partial [Pseudacidobacterium sp.]|nr:hypothetical protein [Pseudacidobacterium sp.]